MFARSFVSAVKVNILLYLTLMELSKSGRTKWDTMKKQIGPLVASAIVVSVSQSIPVLVISSLLQSDGVFVCAFDPSWPKVFHNFVIIHKVAYNDGFVQSICLLALAALLRKRLKHEERTAQYLRRSRVSRDVVGLVLKSIKRELEESCRNLRIDLTLLYTTVICRAARCFLRICDYMFDIGSTVTDAFDARTRKLAFISAWALFVFVEIILLGINYLWWYIHLPELQTYLRTTWLDFTCRSSATVSSSKGGTFSLRNLRQFRPLPEITTDCRVILEQMDSLKEHILNYYAAELNLCTSGAARLTSKDKIPFQWLESMLKKRNLLNCAENLTPSVDARKLKFTMSNDLIG
ncbi:unnamed protein product [Dicrocoelium dendriticum]|nr:unnamed protein product [Dicrocoelium dendriticum]